MLHNHLERIRQPLAKFGPDPLKTVAVHKEQRTGRHIQRLAFIYIKTLTCIVTCNSLRTQSTSLVLLWCWLDAIMSRTTDLHDHFAANIWHRVTLFSTDTKSQTLVRDKKIQNVKKCKTMAWDEISNQITSTVALSKCKENKTSMSWITSYLRVV